MHGAAATRRTATVPTGEPAHRIGPQHAGRRLLPDMARRTPP